MSYTKSFVTDLCVEYFVCLYLPLLPKITWDLGVA